MGSATSPITQTEASRDFGCALSLVVPIAAAGVDELTSKCDECHGTGGNGTDPKVPNIAGASATYLEETMSAYKNGDRPGVKYKPKNGEESDMGAIAKDLSDEDIAALAQHYAALPFKPVPQQVDQGLAEKGADPYDSACEKCHTEGGTLADDDAGIIGGQGKAYLEQQFKMFSDGSRPMPKKMAKKWETVSDDDLKAIIEFLASKS